MASYLDKAGLEYLWGKITSFLDKKANKATTLAGYGITDANIKNGVITLGSNTITPITSTDVDKKISTAKSEIIGGAPTTYDTLKEIADYIESHKSVETALNAAIGNKADKASTLGGYGITDAKISGGTITLGSSTITPVTSIYSATFSVGKFSAKTYTPNSGAQTINIPTNTSHLTNDSGFINSSALSSYLPLTGGTLSGPLKISKSITNDYNFEVQVGPKGDEHYIRIGTRDGNDYFRICTPDNYNNWRDFIIKNEDGALTIDADNSNGGVYLNGGSDGVIVGANNKLYFGNNNSDSSYINGKELFLRHDDTTKRSGHTLIIRGRTGQSGTPNGTEIVSLSPHNDECDLYIKNEDGAVYISGTTGVYGPSDSRLKDNIEDINIDVNDIANAPCVRFNYKKSKKTNVGTLAQYWNEILPEAISENDEGYLYLDSGGLSIATTISLAKEVVKLKNKIDRITKQLNIDEIEES